MKCILWLALVVVFPGLCVGDLPVEPETLRQEAQQAFDDGRYEETLRRCSEVRKWVNTPANTKLLADNGKSWLAVLGRLNELEARAYYELGDYDKARTKVRLASDQMRQRRKFFIEQGSGGMAALFWLVDAKLKFLEGDLERAVAHYGATSSANTEIAAVAKRVGNPKKSLAKYSESQRIIEGILGLSPQPQGVAVDEVWLQINSLLVRLLVSESYARLWGEGEFRDGDVADAEAFLIRGEELLANNVYWKLFVAPDAPFPLSYSRFQDLSEEKRRAVGSQDSIVTEKDLIQFKKIWGEAIDDYLMVMMARAEVAAYSSLSSREGHLRPSTPGKYGVVNAERLYGRARNLLAQQYRPDHPKMLRVKLSLARWYAIVSDPVGLGEETPSGTRLRGLVSMARDCLFTIQQLQLAEASKGGKGKLELLYVEMKALSNLRATHARWPCLSDAQLQEVERRIKEVELCLAGAVDAP
jgi:hypothetical protein